MNKIGTLGAKWWVIHEHPSVKNEQYVCWNDIMERSLVIRTDECPRGALAWLLREIRLRDFWAPNFGC